MTSGGRRAPHPAGHVETVLSATEWSARPRRHEDRVEAWLQPVRDRARRGEKHPVEDFLFTYYAYRPAHLRRWSPGAGVVLEGASPADLEPAAHWRAADAGAVLVAPSPQTVALAAWVVELLDRTAGRAPYLGCFGLHEWAMVHGSDAGAVRHAQWPLRLGRAGTDAVVAANPVRCSHFDAFRFFTDSARPLNALQPTRATQLADEQPGCLHATMDLYKWSYKLAPWVPAELVADCFELARRVRALDMRASPYDLSVLGYEPVRIETPEGRRQYAAEQRGFVAEAAPLRDRLRSAAAALCGASTASPATSPYQGAGA
jgi:hypothetical protein